MAEYPEHQREHENYNDALGVAGTFNRKNDQLAHLKYVVGDGGELYNDTDREGVETATPRPREYTTNGQEYIKYKDAAEPVAVTS